MRAVLKFVTSFLKRLFRYESLSASRAEPEKADVDRTDRGVSRHDANRRGANRRDANRRDANIQNLTDSSFEARASDELKQLVYQATCQFGADERVHASRIALLLKQIDPGFSYEKYQFSKLIDLLKAVPELVILEKIEPKESGAERKKRRLPPIYYVRSRLDTTSLIIECLRAFNRSFDREAEWVHWQSLEEEMKRRSPEFNASHYGFSSFKTLLGSRTDLVEFNPDSPDYVRLAAKVRSSSTRLPAIKTATKPPPKSTLVRPNPARSISRSSQRPRNIESLLKFSGLSMAMLQEKVSDLAVIALPEKWYYGAEPPEGFAYPILKSYLRYTFVRLQYENKVMASVNQRYRAFNTGLLDTLLRPIYALFSPSDVDTQRWTLDFCVAGESYVGKTLVAEFSQLPAAANYFENAHKAFYYLDAGAPTVDWKHVVEDNMARLPLPFLERYAPKGFVARSTQTMSTPDFYEYKRSFAIALDSDPAGYRNIVSRLEEALEKTLRRTQVNYTTAVPTYYPKINSVDLLLPMCLVNEHTVDLALVVRRETSGRYIGHTILTLRQAYNNARLICKLDDHWLPRAMALSQDT